MTCLVMKCYYGRKKKIMHKSLVVMNVKKYFQEKWF